MTQGSVRPMAPREPLAPVKAASPDRSAATPLELLLFVLRSARRHWWLCLLIGLLTACVGVAVVFAIPSTYESTAKIYVTQNSALTASLASGSRRGDDASSALRGLREAVLNEENLLALVREAKLVESWGRTRTWALRLKDQLMVALLGPLKVSDTEKILVEMLEDSLWVTAEDGTSIRFTVWWRDPEAAFRVTELAQKRFLETRLSDETASIARAITLLEAQQQQADAAIEPAIKEMQRVLEKARAQGTLKQREAGESAAKAAPLPKPSTPPVSSAAAEASMERLQEIRRAQRELLEPWQRRLADLRFQLTELRAIFGPAHPTVTQQEAKVSAASESPPELERLRREEAELLASLGRGEPAGEATTTRRPMSTPARPVLPAVERDEDPEVAAARVRVEAALAKSRDVSERLDAAHMEHATSQAGAKFRYAVVEAPEIPRKPFKPKRAVLLGGALAAALLLGLLSGAARELSTGRMVEAWQVRRLGLDVIGEIDLGEAVDHPRT